MRAWVQLFKARLKVDRLTAPIDDLMRLASYCALIGPPEHNQAAYFAIVSLFVKKGRIALWSSSLQSLHFDAATFKAVVDSAIAYNEVLPGGRGLADQNFRLDAVLPVMAMVNHPQTFIQDCANEQYDHPGAIFHPNTLRHAQQHMRGVEGPLADDEARLEILARIGGAHV